LFVGEIFAAHLKQIQGYVKDKQWMENAIQELIALLHKDYPTLMSVPGR